jgi:hypothetical protein
VGWTIALLILGCPSPGSAEDPAVDSVEISTGDDVAALSLGLDGQVRYGLVREDSNVWTSEFRLRRFRPILGFRAFEQFEVKVVPELAGGPELKDGLIRWIPAPWFKAEAGQFAPPFNWERDGSSDYHQFTERSVANAEFQIADGRDIGAQLDFEWEKWLDVEVGVFNGAGSNARVTPGRGHLLAGRIAYAPLGYYHEVEVIPEVLDEFVFIAGAGGYFAFDNSWRDWSPPETTIPEPDLENVAAHVWSVTGDAHVWWWRFSAHAQVFQREVRACCGSPGFPTYTGRGLTAQTGFLVIPERLLMAYRYSQSEPDVSGPSVTREMAGAIQVFFRGNRSKITLEVGGIERDVLSGDDERYGRVQFQLLL